MVWKIWTKIADNVEDLPNSGRPLEFDDESLKSLVEAEPQLTIDKIAKTFNSSGEAIHCQLGELVPYE